MIKKLNSLIKDDRGQVLVLVALSMVVLIGVAALSVDYGYLAWQKRDLQNAADASSLAAAWELPNGGYESRADEYVKKYIDADGVSSTPVIQPDESIIREYTDNDGISTTVTTTKLDEKTVRVEIDRDHNLMLARVLGLDTSRVYAMAEAEVIKEWKGEALPLINLEYNYEEEYPVDAWIKVSPGTNGSINDFYTLGTVDGPDFYYEIEYEDGIEIKKGFASGNGGLDNVTQLHKGLANILNRYELFYIFSLRHDIIESGVVNVDGVPTDINKLKNDDVIDRDQLVLLEVSFTEAPWSVSGKTVNLTYTGNSFDLINTFPEEHLTSPGIASELTK